MLRKVEVSKRDVCQGDIPRTEAFQLEDGMTVPELLRYIARHFLWAYLHYKWEIAGGEPYQTLGFIACNRQNRDPSLKTPGDVVAFLNRQISSDDLVRCCVPPDKTLRDLNIKKVFCIEHYE